jgi:hypothetical protein
LEWDLGGGWDLGGDWDLGGEWGRHFLWGDFCGEWDFGWVEDFGDGGEVSVAEVEGDLFDHGLGVGIGVGGVAAGQVGGGDLEAVEQEAGAFGVEVAAGEAAEDVVEGELDAGAVVDVGHGEAEGGERGVGSAGGGGEGAPGDLVVVAEVLAAEGGRAAAVAVGEDVAAEVAAARVDGCLFGCGWRGLGIVLHGCPPGVL